MEEILEKLSQIEVSRLERRGADFSFSDVQNLNKLIFEKVRILTENPDFIEQLPEQKKTEIINALSSLYNLVMHILNFKPAQENPQSQRDSIAQGIRQSYETFFENLFPYLDLFVLTKKSSETELEKLAGQAKEVLFEIETKNKNADNIIDSLRKVSAEAGVSNFAKVFSNQAEQNKKAAKKWLYASGVTTFTLFIIMLWTFGQINISKEDIDFGSVRNMHNFR